MPVPDVFALIREWDAQALAQVTGRFELALAPGLHAALGQTPAFYGVLCTLTLVAAVLGRWRSVPLVTLCALTSVALAVALAWMGATVVHRAPPFALEASPVPIEWRGLWHGSASFPNRHTLVAAALAGTMFRAWPPLGIVGYLLAVGAALTAVFFGAAWVSDAIAGLLVGTACAVAAPLPVRLVRRAARLVAFRHSAVLGSLSQLS